MRRNDYNLVAKDDTPTFLDHTVANKVFKSLNQLGNINITNGDSTSIVYNDQSIDIKIKKQTFSHVDPKIKVMPPLKVVHDTVKKEFTIYLEGFTRLIKYCGGEGHILFLSEPYDSSTLSLPTPTPPTTT